MKSKNGFNVLAEKNKLQSSVRSSKNLQEKLMGSSNQIWMLSFPPFLKTTTYTVPQNTVSTFFFILTARDAPLWCLLITKWLNKTHCWPSFLQGLVNRGIGIESRGAGLHKFGRVVGGNGAQGAGGSTVCYAGHDGHDFSYLLFQVLDFLVFLKNLSWKIKDPPLVRRKGSPNTVPFWAHQSQVGSTPALMVCKGRHFSCNGPVNILKTENHVLFLSFFSRPY